MHAFQMLHQGAFFDVQQGGDAEREREMPRAKDVTEFERKKFTKKTCHKGNALRDPKKEILRERLCKRNRHVREK